MTVHRGPEPHRDPVAPIQITPARRIVDITPHASTQIVRAKTARFCMKNIMRVGVLTLLSRLLGFARELLLIRCLGKSAQSDAFIAAFRLPNLLYKICAGGALSPALVPIGITVVRAHGTEELSRLMSTLLVVVTSALALLCGALAVGAPWVVRMLAPGFGPLQVHYTVFFVRFMTGFVLLTTASALLSEALRIRRHFTVPALGQVIFNSVCIVGLIGYTLWWPWKGMLVGIVLAGGVVQLIPHVWMYVHQGFVWRRPSAITWHALCEVGKRLIPSATTASMAEVGSLVELQLASFLPVGSVSLLSYTAMFVHMPLGIFATAFSTVIFPDMVRLTVYAPRRLGYLIVESAKLVWWILFPCTVMMIFFSYDIFSTLYRSSAFSESAVQQAAFLLIIRSASLLPFALNKFLLNGCYALQNLRIPSLISFAGTCITLILSLLLMPRYGAYGLAWSGTIVAYLRMGCLLYYLHRVVGLGTYQRSWWTFIVRSIGQLGMIGLITFPLCYMVRSALRCGWEGCPVQVFQWLSDGWGLWVWVGFGVCSAVWYAWMRRRAWGLRMYFLDRRTFRN